MTPMNDTTQPAAAPPAASPPAPAAVRVQPITPDDLPAVGRFLHENLNQRFSPAQWVSSVTHPWAAKAPNHGMQLLDGGRIVGVFLAIYSDQVVDGRPERFCNPHSWCVLDSHRRHSISLILQLVRQKGYHFTMFTPNPKVAEVFRGLKFKDLDARQWTWLNLPSPALLRPGGFAVSEPAGIEQRLTGEALRAYCAHKDIPWLRFCAFGTRDRASLAIFKEIRWKRTRCAWVLHVSDPGHFLRDGAILRWHLWRRHGLASTRLEGRWLPADPRDAFSTPRTQDKLFFSSTLADGQVLDVYSELMSLDV